MNQPAADASESESRQSEPRGDAYLSFLLRLWAVTENGVSVWRASLERVTTGQRRGFANLESLFAFLKVHTEQTTTEKSTTDGVETTL